MSEKVAGYGRVSTIHQVEDGTSSEEQERIVTEECKRKGWELVHFYSDDGFSGKNSLRPGYVQLLNDAKLGKFKMVVFTKLDRFGRSLKDILNICSELSGLGVKVFCINQPEINSEGVYGKLLMQLLGAFAEFEHSIILERTQSGKKAKAKKGAPGSGRSPYGRTFDKEKRIWGVDAKKQEKIQEIAHLYLNTETNMDKLAKQFGMNQMNLYKILTKTAGSEFIQTFTKDGITEVITTQVPPLLDDGTIKQIKEKAESKRRWDHTKRKYDYLLSGRILDNDTGLSLTGSHVARTGKRYYYYYKSDHPKYSVDADAIEGAVWTALVDALSNSKSLMNAVFDGKPKEEMTDHLLKKRSKMEKVITKIEAHVENFMRFVEFYEGGNINELFEKYSSRLKQWNSQMKEAKISIETIDKQLKNIPTKTAIESRRKFVQQEILKRQEESYFQSGHTFDDLPYEEQKKLFNMLFGGRDAEGKRYGVYIMPEHKGVRKFVCYGLLGKFNGWVSKTDSDAWENSINITNELKDKMLYTLSREII
jgi:DNA invertase Pin-like site-specific DNA recombinase